LKIEFKVNEQYDDIIKQFAKAWNNGNTNEFAKREFLEAFLGLLEDHPRGLFKQEFEKLEGELHPKDEVIVE